MTRRRGPFGAHFSTSAAQLARRPGGACAGCVLRFVTASFCYRSHPTPVPTRRFVKVPRALLLGRLGPVACSKAPDGAGPNRVGPAWYPSPPNRLQLVVPHKYGPPQDSVAVAFRNPSAVKTRYHFRLRRYAGAAGVQTADAQNRWLNPGKNQQMDCSTLPTGAYVHGKDAAHVLPINADTQVY